jgi:predicted RNA-binding Zn-ribbon protein involved in translation (DUF1610 family)
MDLNCPVSIEQVANGYVVRPLSESREAALTHRARLCPDLPSLKEWLLGHFRTTCCPQCGSVAVRDQFALWMTDTIILRCQKCQLATAEGCEEWISIKLDGTIGCHDRLTQKLLDMARKVAR